MKVKSEKQYELESALREVRNADFALANVEDQSIFLAVDAEHFDENVDVDDDVFNAIEDIVLNHLRDRVKRARYNLESVQRKQSE